MTKTLMALLIAIGLMASGVQVAKADRAAVSVDDLTLVDESSPVVRVNDANTVYYSRYRTYYSYYRGGGSYYRPSYSYYRPSYGSYHHSYYRRYYWGGNSNSN